MVQTSYINNALVQVGASEFEEVFSCSKYALQMLQLFLEVSKL